jgi:hypothetical protein
MNFEWKRYNVYYVKNVINGKEENLIKSAYIDVISEL